MDTRLAIGIPSGGSINTKTIACLFDAMMQVPYEKLVQMPVGGYSNRGRTVIVDKAQEAKVTHLLMIDADMVFPPDVMVRLFADDKDVVGVNYNERKHPLVSTIKLADEQGKLISKPSSEIPGELFKVYAVGFGVVLIKMSVFDKIPKPYFPLEHNGEFVTEDYSFAKKCHEAGIDVWCDNTIQVHHIGEYLY